MRIICIHHAAINDELPQFARVRAYHNAGAGGKWPGGHGIQYHVLGERNGERIQSYDLEKITWHSGSKEWNEKSFGYCFAGDLTKQGPTEAQLSSFFTFWKDCGFPPIVYHREVRPEPTACPGIYRFREEMEKRRKKALEQQLKSAERALKRFKGTSRGNLLERLIKRIMGIIHIESV